MNELVHGLTSIMPNQGRRRRPDLGRVRRPALERWSWASLRFPQDLPLDGRERFFAGAVAGFLCSASFFRRAWVAAAAFTGRERGVDAAAGLPFLPAGGHGPASPGLQPQS